MNIKAFTAGFGVAIAISATMVTAGIPKFWQETLPEHAATDMLQSWSAVQGEGSALDKKTRELVSLAVAAQIPCVYCVYASRLKLEKMGVSEAEIREAIATAGYIRLWSTMLQGGGYDFNAFKAEYDQLVAGS